MLSNSILKKGLLLLLVYTICIFVYGKGIDPETVVAEIDNNSITYGDLEKEISKIPPMYQQRFKSVKGQTQVLQSMITKELFYRKGKALNIESDAEFKSKIKNILEGNYVAIHNRMYVDEKVNPSKTQLENYYKTNIGKYTIEPKASIFYIAVNSDSTAKIVRKQLDNNVDLIDILNKYSINKYSKKRSGKINSIRLKPDGDYISGVGKDKALMDAIKSADDNDKFYGPITTEKGIHFFKIINKTDAHVKKYAEVKTQVEKDIYPVIRNDIYNELITRLKKKYNVSMHPELETVILPNINEDHPLANVYAITSNQASIQKTFLELGNTYKNLPVQQRAEIEKSNAYKYWINQELDKKLSYQNAVDSDIKEEVLKDPKIKDAIKMEMVKYTYEKLVTDKIDVNQEKIEAYYNENIQHFTNKPFRHIRFFSYEKEKSAKKYHKKLVKLIKKDYAEEKFNKKVAKLNKKNQFDAKNNEIENIFKDKMIPRIGTDNTILKQIWATDVNKVSPVFTDKNGKHCFLLVTHETPPMKRPIKEVSARIEKMLVRSEAQTLYKENMEQLKKEFNVQEYPDRLIIKLTVDEMYANAEQFQKQRRFADAIDIYNQIIESFPNGKDDYKATFMKAFILSENMNQKEEALAQFKSFVEKFPEGDLNDSAVFMIENLENPDAEATLPFLE